MKNIEKPMPILLIEDNEVEVNEFKHYIEGRAMQTAINNAWRSTSIDDLMMHYKARINYETGVPTPTEFIYYYRDKIKENL